MTPQQNALQQFQSQQNPQPIDSSQILKNILSKDKQLINSTQDQQDTSQASAPITQALGLLAPQNTKDPVASIGKAIATPNYAGYCLKWVDDQTGNANRQSTAFADYQANANSVIDSTDAPKGARVYFGPDASNNGMGHVGLSNGDGTFTSATDNGVQTFNLTDWEKNTGQQYLGYVQPSS